MRDEILNLAELQLKAGGYHNLSFTEIAKELNTTRANLHYHFKNKESLALEAIHKYGQSQFEELAEVTKIYSGDFFKVIGALEEYFWQKAKAMNSTALCVCNQIAREPDLPENLKNMNCSVFHQLGDLFEDLLKTAISNKQIRKNIDIKREVARVHVIMAGVMTTGQFMSDVDEAKSLMSGLLLDWAETLK